MSLFFPGIYIMIYHCGFKVQAGDDTRRSAAVAEKGEEMAVAM